ASTETGILKPWITLIVLKDGEFDALDVIRPPENQKTAVPIRWIKQAHVSALPDLTYSWMWAHVQVTAQAQDQLDAGTVQQWVSDEGPEGESHVVARLICPRRLARNTKYT